MIAVILIVYGASGPVEIGTTPTQDVCWTIARQLADGGITADCRVRETASQLAPITSPRPMPKPSME